MVSSCDTSAFQHIFAKAAFDQSGPSEVIRLCWTLTRWPLALAGLVVARGDCLEVLLEREISADIGLEECAEACSTWDSTGEVDASCGTKKVRTAKPAPLAASETRFTSVCDGLNGKSLGLRGPHA